MIERLEVLQFKMNEYDRGWDDYLAGAEGPQSGTESKEWWKGFNDAASEYPSGEER